MRAAGARDESSVCCHLLSHGRYLAWNGTRVEWYRYVCTLKDLSRLMET